MVYRKSSDTHHFLRALKRHAEGQGYRDFLFFFYIV